MTQEIIYTSAPQGLRPGSYGFCTVATTPGMASSLAERLESLSGYRHVHPPGHPRAIYNPVVHSHLHLKVGGQKYHVLSRLADAGFDYSQRTNKLVHHVALEPGELVAGGPAWLLSQRGFMETAWSGQPRVLPAGRRPVPGDLQRGICSRWAEITRDAAWAAVLAQSAIAGSRPAYLIFPEGLDPLPLLVEAQSLLPVARRWEVSFSTYFTRLPPGVDCQWRCLLVGSPEAAALAGQRGDLVIDLTRPLPAPPETPLTHAARTGQFPAEIALAATSAASPRTVPSTSQPVSAWRGERDTSNDELRLGPPPVPGGSRPRGAAMPELLSDQGPPALEAPPMLPRHQRPELRTASFSWHHLLTTALLATAVGIVAGYFLRGLGQPTQVIAASTQPAETPAAAVPPAPSPSETAASTPATPATPTPDSVPPTGETPTTPAPPAAESPLIVKAPAPATGPSVPPASDANTSEVAPPATPAVPAHTPLHYGSEPLESIVDDKFSLKKDAVALIEFETHPNSTIQSISLFGAPAEIKLKAIEDPPANWEVVYEATNSILKPVILAKLSVVEDSGKSSLYFQRIGNSNQTQLLAKCAIGIVHSDMQNQKLLNLVKPIQIPRKALSQGIVPAFVANFELTDIDTPKDFFKGHYVDVGDPTFVETPNATWTRHYDGEVQTRQQRLYANFQDVYVLVLTTLPTATNRGIAIGAVLEYRGIKDAVKLSPAVIQDLTAREVKFDTEFGQPLRDAEEKLAREKAEKEKVEGAKDSKQQEKDAAAKRVTDASNEVSRRQQLYDGHAPSFPSMVRQKEGKELLEKLRKIDGDSAPLEISGEIGVTINGPSGKHPVPIFRFGK